MIFRKTVLVRLHRARTGKRGADKTDPDRLELRRRQQVSGIAGPEAVTVAGDDRESRDLRVAYEIVDFAALVVRAAPIAAADLRERVRGPLVLRHAVGKVCGVGPQIERALRVAPDLPGRRGSTKLIHEPLLLSGAEDRARR